MKEKLEKLRSETETFLRTHEYKDECIRRINFVWDNLSSYMEENHIGLYSEEVGTNFLNLKNQGCIYSELNHYRKSHVRYIMMLTDMLNIGTVRQRSQLRTEYIYSGVLGDTFLEFFRQKAGDFSIASLDNYRRELHKFYKYMLERNLSVSALRFYDVVSFMLTLEGKTNSVRANTIRPVRAFFRFLCENYMLGDNHERSWQSLLRARIVKTEKMPSVYTVDEVDSILKAVDRANSCGKRDYAMLLLAVRYGLRSSDIIGLRHTCIDWEHNRIVVSQHKTGKTVAHPLTEEVGGAVVDYIMHGRPKVESPFIFLTGKAPYKEISSNVLTKNIGNWMRSAGVDISGRKHGAHSMRHSLATNLLNSNESLPVISEILGHKTTESTKLYLRVSIEMLRKCALDVTVLPLTFYTNLYAKR